MITAPARRLLLLGMAMALLLAACAPSAGVGQTARPWQLPAAGRYAYQSAPLIWQFVTIDNGDVVGGSGQVFAWNCVGARWAIGSIPARVRDGYLEFGDERFPIVAGALDARWRAGAADPRSAPAPVCADATPTTKVLLSGDGARALIKQRVTAIAPVLVPTALPDRVRATADTRPDSFDVTYVGDTGVRVSLRTAIANPQPVRSDGTQERLAFRGDARAFYQALDGGAKTTRTLLWLEPATKPSAAAAAVCACVPYALVVDGLTEAEFWKIAESLR